MSRKVGWRGKKLDRREYSSRPERISLKIINQETYHLNRKISVFFVGLQLTNLPVFVLHEVNKIFHFLANLFCPNADTMCYEIGHFLEIFL